MAKNIVNDVLPRERRTIRNVSIKREKDSEEDFEEIGHEQSVYERRRRKGFPKSLVWIVVIVVFLLSVFAFSTLFSGATLSITPKSQTFSIDENFTAKRGFGVSELGYEILPIEKTLSQSIPASGEEDIQERASGKIVIYNNFSTSPQRLIKNTRFEAPSGLIFRIGDSVTVPGQKKVEGNLEAGSIEVTVSADSTGEEYNIGPADFTIPGFKSDKDRYTNFYAKSESGMSGGFKGVRKVVDESQKKDVKNSLQETLKDQVLKEAKSQVPPGFILFDKAYRMDFESLPDQVSGNSVTLSEKVLFSGFILKEDDVNNSIVAKVAPEIGLGESYVNNLRGLNFNLTDVPKSEDETLKFSVSGDSFLVWKINEDKVKIDLAGALKSEVNTILGTYKSIAKTSMVTRPFWRKSLPEDPKSIKIELIAPIPQSRNGN